MNLCVPSHRDGGFARKQYKSHKVESVGGYIKYFRNSNAEIPNSNIHNSTSGDFSDHWIWQASRSVGTKREIPKFRDR